MIFTVLKAACLGAYIMAFAGVAGLITGELSTRAQHLALAMLLIHVLELVVMFKHVRLYRGPLPVSIALTLLFGILHWRPLAREAAKSSQQA
jgi:hypothetical protein